MQCLCSSDKSYSECCEPIISNHSSTTALELMRSRYSAYVLVEINYLIATCHPKIRNRQSPKDLENWAKSNQWKGLEILKTENGSPIDFEGIVAFKASYTDENGKDCVHHEKSTFVKENGKWYYAEGEINPKGQSAKISRNNSK